MTIDTQLMLEIARRHAQAEAAGDFEATLATLVAGPVGGRTEHRMLAILTFDSSGMTGERMYGSDELLRFLAEPLWDEIERI